MFDMLFPKEGGELYFRLTRDGGGNPVFTCYLNDGKTTPMEKWVVEPGKHVALTSGKETSRVPAIYVSTPVLDGHVWTARVSCWDAIGRELFDKQLICENGKAHLWTSEGLKVLDEGQISVNEFMSTRDSLLLHNNVVRDVKEFSEVPDGQAVARSMHFAVYYQTGKTQRPIPFITKIERLVCGLSSELNDLLDSEFFNNAPAMAILTKVQSLQGAKDALRKEFSFPKEHKEVPSTAPSFFEQTHVRVKLKNEGFSRTISVADGKCEGRTDGIFLVIPLLVRRFGIEALRMALDAQSEQRAFLNACVTKDVGEKEKFVRKRVTVNFLRSREGTRLFSWESEYLADSRDRELTPIPAAGGEEEFQTAVPIAEAVFENVSCEFLDCVESARMDLWRPAQPAILGVLADTVNTGCSGFLRVRYLGSTGYSSEGPLDNFASFGVSEILEKSRRLAPDVDSEEHDVTKLVVNSAVTGHGRAFPSDPRPAEVLSDDFMTRLQRIYDKALEATAEDVGPVWFERPPGSDSGVYLLNCLEGWNKAERPCLRVVVVSWKDSEPELVSAEELELPRFGLLRCRGRQPEVFQAA